MRLIKSSLLFSFTFCLFLSSCVKDKGFSNNEYGISDPNVTAKGLGFSLGNNTANTTGLDAVSSTVQNINDLLVIGLFDGDFPTNDVKINFVIDNSIVTDYITANSLPSFKVFSPARYSISSSIITVKAGTKFAQLPIVVPTTVPLSLDTTYGIGVRITSNDGGYNMPERTKKLLLFFNLKNKYDGIYTVNGIFLDTANATFSGRYPLTYLLATTGPNSCDVRMRINGEDVPGYLFNAGGSASYFGNWGITVFFDPLTNAVTEVRNYYGVPSNATTGVGTPSAGTGAPLYAASNTRRAIIDPAGINRYIFDPNTPNVKPFVKIKYRMLQPSNALANSVGFRCKFDETWTYKEPRP